MSGGGDGSVPVNSTTHAHMHTLPLTPSLAGCHTNTQIQAKASFIGTNGLSHTPMLANTHTFYPCSVSECRCGSLNPSMIPWGGEEGYWKEKLPWHELKATLVFSEYTATSCFIVQQSMLQTQFDIECCSLSVWQDPMPYAAIFTAQVNSRVAQWLGRVPFS